MVSGNFGVIGSVLSIPSCGYFEHFVLLARTRKTVDRQCFGRCGQSACCPHDVSHLKTIARMKAELSSSPETSSQRDAWILLIAFPTLL
jgi:hypothetical protein